MLVPFVESCFAVCLLDESKTLQSYSYQIYLQVEYKPSGILLTYKCGDASLMTVACDTYSLAAGTQIKISLHSF